MCTEYVKKKPGLFGRLGEVGGIANPFNFMSCVNMGFCLFFKGCFETHHLVLLGHVLAVAGYFPPVLITKIFNVSFLSQLDAQLEGAYLPL